MVSVGTLATFFMISFGTLWRRYHSAKQPLGPVLAAQLAGIVVCSLGEPFHGGNKPARATYGQPCESCEGCESDKQTSFWCTCQDCKQGVAGGLKPASRCLTGRPML